MDVTGLACALVPINHGTATWGEPAGGTTNNVHVLVLTEAK